MKELYDKLYEKLASIPFLRTMVGYFEENPFMFGVLVALGVFILVLLCIIVGLHRKAKKALKAAKIKALEFQNNIEDITEEQKNAKTTEETPIEETVEEVIEEVPVEESVEEVEETPIEETVEEVEETPVEETVEEVEETPIEEIVEEVEETPIEETVEEVEETPIEENVEEVEETPIEENVEEVEETPVEESVEEVEETPVEESVEEVEETPVEENIEEVEETPIEEIVEEVEETPIEENAHIEDLLEKVVEEKKNTLSQAQEVSETISMIENRADEEEPSDHYDESETDRLARFKGKWTLCRMITDSENHEELYFFELHSANGEKLLSSEEYTTYQGALRGIETHKANILKGNVKIIKLRSGEYTFKVLSGKNTLLCRSEARYPTKEFCENAVNATIRFAMTAILDENLHDIAIKIPREDDSPIEYPTFDGEGRWIISSGLSVEGEQSYYFELFSANNKRLLESEDYATFVGAVNGSQTYKRNIALNNIKISLTKQGDYIFKILNANGQLLCLGEHYKTKRLCERAAEEIEYYASHSAILTSGTNN